MSIHHIAWVLQHSEAEHSERLVLLSLANHANDHDVAYPGIATIGAETRLSESTVHAALGRLVKAGALTRIAERSSYGTTQYLLILDPPESGPSRIERSNLQNLEVQPPESGLQPPESGPEPSSNQQEKHQKANITAQTELLPDNSVEETWEVYVLASGRPKAMLTPKVRRWIVDAHKAVGVEETRQAIRGLAASDYHQEKGYVGIEHAIRPKNNETIEGRVAFMAAKAPASGSSPLSDGELLTEEQFAERLQPEGRSRFEHIKAAITAMLEHPDDEALKADGQRQLSRMQSIGFEVVIEGQRVTGYRKAGQ